MLGTAVRADDASSLKEELADLKAAVASMEGLQASAGDPCNVCRSCGGSSECLSGDANNLTSMKKKGFVQIGGSIEINVLVIEREDRSNTTDATGATVLTDDDDVLSTHVRTMDADLDFKISASKDTFLKIKLDTDDFWNSKAGQDDLLEECYFMWNSVMGSDFGLWFGKKELPFGYDQRVLSGFSYHHDGGESFLGRSWEEADDPFANPHAAVGNMNKPEEIDDVFQVGAVYKWMDIAKLEMAVFQNKDSKRGMHEDRSDDHFGFQSGAARLWLFPVEGLKVQISALNKHIDSYGDEDIYGSDAEADSQALSVGFNYKFAGIPLTLLGEYSHGFNWAYSDEYDADVAQLGMIWGVTECIDLGLSGEWLGIDDDRGAADMEEDYYKLIFGAKYKFDSGIYITGEYIREWYDRETAGAADEDRDANVFIFATGWVF